MPSLLALRVKLDGDAPGPRAGDDVDLVIEGHGHDGTHRLAVADDGMIVVRRVLPGHDVVERWRQQIQIQVFDLPGGRAPDQRVAFAALHRDHEGEVSPLLESPGRFLALRAHALRRLERESLDAGVRDARWKSATCPSSRAARTAGAPGRLQESLGGLSRL